MYVLWLHLIFVSLIPFTVLFWLNKTIHRKLSKQLVRLRRTGHRSLRRRELRLARVSLGIVLLYMVCHLPKMVPTVCEIVYKDAKVCCIGPSEVRALPLGIAAERSVHYFWDYVAKP